MSVQFTQEQQAAIAARGKVIVSASAGSGKTAVMIERLVSLILSGADVKKVLAVTFTNKAATQMREKLRSALVKRIAVAEGEEKARLKEQLTALPLADICTIHAFCGRLVRANFFLADTDPAFRIISPDDGDGRELSARAMDETFEEAYEEGGERFRQLLSAYFYKKKDARLRVLLWGLYRNFRGLPNYREELIRAGKEDEFDGVCAYLHADFCARAEELGWETQTLKEYFLEALPSAVKVCDGVLSAVEGVLASQDLFALTQVELGAIARMPASTKLTGETLKNHAKLSYLSKSVKALYGELREFATREEEYRRYQDGRERASALATLLLRYDEIYSALKKEKGLLDYDDLEHCAVRVLSNEDALKGVRERYEYLFVDEYQDVNLAQERILSLVGGEEIFLVGDRKQAIYGFRGSKSQYFTQKTEQFPHSLCLTENFRSAAGVLDGVNRVFSRAMTTLTCGFDYTSDSLMRGGRRYENHTGGVYFLRYAKNKAEKAPPREVYSVLNGGSERVEDAQAQAILRLVEGEIGREWYDADGEEGAKIKQIGYGDIAILARKNSGDAEKIIAALSERDIPVTTTARVNICAFWEIRLLVDVLSYLDNAEQDIPLATTLLSALGSFSEEELAQIRLCFSAKYFFRDACREYADKMADDLAQKLNDFFQRMEGLRASTCVRSARETLCALLAVGLETQIAAKQGGGLRLRRVRRFLDEAEGSVHAFLARLARTGYEIGFSESGGEDAVKVLTMHASKGLEYPVVILASLDTSFHGAERDEAMWTERFSIAPKCFDERNKVVYETVLRRASAVHQEREAVKDELNLLYVAMTRARYRLYMLFDEKESVSSVRYAKRFSDFIDRDACADYLIEQEEAERTAPERKALAFRPDEEQTRRILSVYGKPYAHAESVKVPVKSSATELMKGQEKAKSFGKQGQGGTADEGTAYHAFLEHVRFGESVESELARMREESLMSEERLALLDREKLQAILNLPAFKRLEGKELLREQKFLVSLQWDEMTEETASDEVVFQGAIDLLYLDGDGAHILDYKYSSHTDEQIKKDYAVQMKLYKKAVARALKIDERKIQASILNIAQGREIAM